MSLELRLNPSIPPPFEPALNLADLPIAAGIGLAALLSIALWSKKFLVSKSQDSSETDLSTYNPNRFLAFLLLLIAYSLLEGLLVDSGYFYYLPQFFVSYALPRYLLIGPLLYFYVLIITSPESVHYRHSHLLHLLPFAITLVIQMPFIIMLDVNSWLLLVYQDAYALKGNLDVHIDGLVSSYGILQLNSPYISEAVTIGTFYGVLFVYFTAFNIENYFELVTLWSYISVCILLILKHRKTLGKITSTVDDIELDWMLHFLMMMLIVIVILSLDRFIDLSDRLHEYFYLRGPVMQAFVVFMLFYIGMKALKQPQIFSPELRAGFQAINLEASASVQMDGIRPADDLEQRKVAPKYENSILTPELSHLVAKDICEYMETNKPYLKSDLTLTELARQMSLSSHTLSQVLNETLKQNFFDFINGYRVAAVKERLMTDTSTSESILQIALDSGFNSKSAFYSAFKKQSGMSPTQWRNSQKTRSSE